MKIARAPTVDASRRRLAASLGLGAAGLLRPALALAGLGSYWSRPQVREFAARTAERFGLPPEWIASAIRAGRPSETAARWMGSVAPAPGDWRLYRRSQIDEHRLARGLSFWWKYQQSLDQARDSFGTPHEIVVAIIGVESHYGRVTGRFRVLDVLLTLGFDLARRADEYQEELAQFLMLCREQDLDPASILGSIAGAIGMPQFLPSSIRRYAVDFDADGRIDLARSAHDAIGSVANFLAAHGWQPDLPVMLPADMAPPDPAESLRPIALGYRDDSGQACEEPRIATANFEALLGYNRSNLYAAAVADLALELRSRFDADPPQPASASG